MHSCCIREDLGQDVMEEKTAFPVSYNLFFGQEIGQVGKEIGTSNH